ncbi:hypothetical protein EX30DRAFT_337406 [Ascodesmis nigricans]|uniref:Aromatic amino acid beta-eliminating lyase/threonine aldolase domain-containing protein n=1 Tax=Ascodesmis nigricans TaxID=341454 RepID=A0A4S2N6M1_9PEZI|nr:hypothetical protein EX30DRAFT_337406 [Ascodesmis nigricans]
MSNPAPANQTSAYLTLPTNSPFLTPSPSSHDFRSDTVTTPSLTQLHALTSPTLSLGDDVYSESTTTTNLTTRLCTLFNKPHGLFVTSGTQSNQIALLTHLARSGGPPHSIIADSDSHILNYEAGGTATLGGCQIMPITPQNGKWVTLEEVKRKAAVGAVGEDEHYAGTKVVCLENTINGVVMPVEEMRRIREWAREVGVKVHLDGARLWNAAVAVAEERDTAERGKEYEVTGQLRGTVEALRELTACVDTVSVCLSKGIGAPVGSVLLADDEKFIAHARRFRKMLGGGLRQTGVLTAMADAAVTEVWESNNAALLQRTHRIARRLSKKWVELGGTLNKEVESSMLWLGGIDDVDGGVERWEALAKEDGCKVAYSRVVVHWQITDEAVKGLERAMERYWVERKQGTWGSAEDEAKEAKKVGYR